MVSNVNSVSMIIFWNSLFLYIYVIFCKITWWFIFNRIVCYPMQATVLYHVLHFACASYVRDKLRHFPEIRKNRSEFSYRHSLASLSHSNQSYADTNSQILLKCAWSLSEFNKISGPCPLNSYSSQVPSPYLKYWNQFNQKNFQEATPALKENSQKRIVHIFIILVSLRITFD